MAKAAQLLEIKQVECEVCLKEIPVSGTMSEEVADYVTYFCGLDCYAKWKEQLDEQNKQEK
jgi:hypothetical protein